MGIEPTYPAWKAGVLADVLISQGQEAFGREPRTLRVSFLLVLITMHWLLKEAELCTTPNELISLGFFILLSY